MSTESKDMIIEHYESFRTKLRLFALNQENWDILRTESIEMAYAIEDSIEQYERNCKESKSYDLLVEKIKYVGNAERVEAERSFSLAKRYYGFGRMSCCFMS